MILSFLFNSIWAVLTIIIFLRFYHFSHLVFHFNVLVATLNHLFLRASLRDAFACTFIHIHGALRHTKAALPNGEHVS